MPASSEAKAIDIALIRQACSNCSLRHLCLPVGISGKDIDRLDHIVKRRRPLARGSYVFHMGEPFRALYAIRSGSVKTYTLDEDGSEQVTGFHLPGEIIGLDAINAEQHHCAAKVLETTSVCELPYHCLEELTCLVPGLGRQLLRIMSREILAEEQLLAVLSKKSAEERLATLLINLSMRLQERGLSSREFQLSMSRSDIGNYLGLALETVSRLFTRLQQQGLIAVQHKRIRIEAMPQLRELAGLRPSKVSRCAPGGR